MTTNKDLYSSAFFVCLAMGNATDRKLRYELQLGSKTNGVSYTLDIIDTDVPSKHSHHWLGRTKLEAERSLMAMLGALNAACLLKGTR